MCYDSALEKLKAKGLNIDIIRFLVEFNTLSRIGWVDGYGMDRLALSENHIRVRRELIKRLNELNARISCDEAGNIIAEIGEGSEAIAIGSHLDSVPGGGRFDGAYGVIAGLEVLRIISGSGKKLRHRLMLIDFNNEEGSRWNPPLLGSGLSCGVYDRDFVYFRIDRDGIRFGDALKESGFLGAPENNLKHRRPKFYIELHIEQGPILHSKGYDIGVVQGIAGLRVLRLRYRGRADHAASPIGMRRDAFIGLARLATKLRDYAFHLEDRLRVTIGSINITPNIFNIVPGEASFTVDIRSYDESLIDRTAEYIISEARNIAEDEKLDLSYELLWNIDRVSFDKEVVDAIEESCNELGFKCMKIWSWAGHDAQNIARISRVGMIFIPSINGISHSKEEFSRDEDLVKGLLVLANTILKLDSL